MSNTLEIVEVQNGPRGFYYVTSPGHVLELQALPDGSVFVPMSAAEQIDSFGDLQPGWDYGSGSIVENSTITAAHVWNRLLTIIGFETSASPGSEGEISISGSRDQYHLEVIVEPDQSTSVAYDIRGNQEYYHLHRPTVEVLGSVLDVAGEIWSASTWSTPRNMTLLGTSGPGSRSAIMGGPFQYSPPNALMNLASQLANTYVGTGVSMNTSVANLPYSGGSTQTTYPAGGQSGSTVPKRNAISSSKG